MDATWRREPSILNPSCKAWVKLIWVSQGQPLGCKGTLLGKEHFINPLLPAFGHEILDVTTFSPHVTWLATSWLLSMPCSLFSEDGVIGLVGLKKARGVFSVAPSTLLQSQAACRRLLFSVHYGLRSVAWGSVYSSGHASTLPGSRSPG